MSTAAPRAAPASAAITMPAATASRGPVRAIRSDPGIAASANIDNGRPIRSPTWVSDMRRSSWISGITGGTARIVMRMATPASQSTPMSLTNRPVESPAVEFPARSIEVGTR